jgi:cell division septation protein DedD
VRDGKSCWMTLIMICSVVLLLTCLGCATQQAARGTASEARQGDIPADTTRAEERTRPTTQTSTSYDLESEMPEDDQRVKPEDLEEEFDLPAADTFAVRDVAAEKTETADYGLGYRVQVFASNELERAKGIKAKIIADTGYPAYIEFESDLYKVRVGNFRTREAAAQARSEIVEFYPDCWIVQTTIRK